MIARVTVDELLGQITAGHGKVVYKDYVTTIKKYLMPKEMISLMSTTEQNFDYIEHLLLGLRTITYYGKTM